MSKIIITMDADDEYADPGHRTGVTEAGYDGITDALEPFGSDVEIEAAP